MSEFKVLCPVCGHECFEGATTWVGWDECMSDGFILLDYTCHECKTEFTTSWEYAATTIMFEKDDDL